MGAYHQLWQVEKSFRMSKTDLRARPIFHHQRESIDAHLTIVFAALAVARWLEATTSWSTKKLVKTLRRYHTVQIKAGEQIITAADPLPDDVRVTLEKIARREYALIGTSRDRPQNGHATAKATFQPDLNTRRQQTVPPAEDPA